jgi:Holliday junction resolvase
MVESEEHLQLKDYAKVILQRMGFGQSDIHEEYSVSFEGMKERLTVDVVGISNTKKVAIECGTTPSHKTIKLQMYFDEVIILPYFRAKISDLYEGDKKALIEKIVTLEKQLELSSERYEKLQRDTTIQISDLSTKLTEATRDSDKWFSDKYDTGLLILLILDAVNAVPNDFTKWMPQGYIQNFRRKAKNRLEEINKEPATL